MSVASGPIAPRRRAPLPTGFLGLLLLIGLSEGWIRRHDRDFTDAFRDAWRRAGQWTGRAEVRNAEVLCLGDSLVLMGVAPRILSEQLGRPAHGLAVFRGQAATAYLLLRRALDAGARPRVVLLDGELLGEDPRSMAGLWAELLRPRELLDLAVAARDPSFAAEIATAQVLASARGRFEIRQLVRAALAGEAFSLRHETIPRARNWSANAGAQIAADPAPGLAQTDAGVAEMLERSRYQPGRWYPHKLNHVYVRRLLDLARARDIAVFWVFPPVQPEVQARREAHGYNAGFDAYLDRLMSLYPNLAVLDARGSRYPASTLVDLTHLSRTGAVAFSEALATRLAGCLEAPLPADASARRYVLPPYEPPKNLAAVEDLGDSAAVLRAAAAQRAATRR